MFLAPLDEVLEPAFEIYRRTHPWVADHPLTPKSIVRDMFERAMDFGDYVRHYELTRVEGTLLRYLSDAYRTLGRTIPEDSKTPDIEDITAWLGELVRQVDSSLVTEWEALSHPDELVADPEALLAEEPPPVTANRRAFTILVRNAMFQRVEHLAHRRWGDLEERER